MPYDYDFSEALRNNREPDDDQKFVLDESDRFDEDDSSDSEDDIFFKSETADGGDCLLCHGINAEKGVLQNHSLFPNRTDKEDLICSITSQDVTDFQDQTRLWYTENRPLNAYEGYGKVPMTSVKPDGICALYRVVSNDGTKMRLQSITVDLWLDGHGDLRDIGMMKHAVNTLCGKRFEIKRHFFMGDVIFVQKLVPTKFALGKDSWNEVINTDPRECHKAGFTPFWNVQEYQLVERIALPDRFAVAADRERDRFEADKKRKADRNKAECILRLYLALEGAPDLFRVHTKNLPQICSGKDVVMVGTVLVPRGRSAVFSFSPNNINERRKLTKKYLNSGENVSPKFGFLFSRIANSFEKDCVHSRDNIYQMFSNDYAAGTAWLRRGFAQAVPSLGAFERFFMDTNPHTLVFKPTEHKEDFLRFDFSVGSAGKRAWRSDRHLYVKPLDGEATTERITRVTWAFGCVTVEAKATGTDALTLYKNKNKLVTIQQVAPIISGLEEEFYSSSDPLDILDKHRFQRAFIAAFGGPALPPLQTRLHTYTIFYKGVMLTLLDEQVRVLEAALKSTSPLAVAASFGSGKTFIANIILANIIELLPDKVHLLVAQSNYAVVNAVNIAFDFDDYKHLRIVRLISPQNMGLREERTKFDLPVLMRRLFSSQDHLRHLTPEERKFAVNYLKLIGRNDELSWTAREKNHPWKRRDWSKAMKIFFKIYKPQRIFCTTSTLLLLSKEKGRTGKRWTESIDTLVFDEASQLSAPMFAMLAHRLPHARPILIGDSKQLEPFVPTTRSPLLRKLATGLILANIARDERWPTLPVNSVWRCHPELTNLLSDVFYHGKLNAAVSAAERSGMLNNVYMPNPKYPIAMLFSSGTERPQDTSYINKGEEADAVNVANVLTTFVENDGDIAIICKYRAQADNISQRLRNTKIFVGTIDATQGREFRASIVCTTRTSKPHPGEDGINFFTHSNRVNVALLRSKELLIILGNRAIMKNEDTWKSIHEIVEKNDGCATVNGFLKNNQDSV